MKQKGFVGIIYLFILGIVLLAFGYFVVTCPYRVFGSEVKPPFIKGQIVLAEKLTYLLKNPEVGDRVVFSPQTSDSVFIGTVTATNIVGNVTSYKVLSAAYTTRIPWEISKDKIKGKVYYPLLTNDEVLKVLPLPLPESAQTSQSDQNNQTGDLRSYINITQGYRVKYPNGWVAQDNPNGSLSIESANFKQNPKNHLEAQAEEGASLLVHRSSDFFPSIKDGDVIKGSDTVVDKKVSNIEKAEVDGYEVMKWDFRAVNDTEFKGIKAIISKNNRSYTFLMTYSNDSYKEIFNQILSTFKFLDQSSTDETTNWKTYTNKAYRLSVKYPNNWVTYMYGYSPGDQVPESKDYDGFEMYFSSKYPGAPEISLEISSDKATSLQLQTNVIKNYGWKNKTINEIFIDGAKGTEVTGYENGKRNIAVVSSSGNFIFKLQTLGDGADVLEKMLPTLTFDKKTLPGKL